MRVASPPHTSALLPFVCFLLVIGLMFAAPPIALAAGKGEPGDVYQARVELGERGDVLQTLHDLDVDVDAVFDDWVRVYVVGDELGKLEMLGLEVTVFPEEPRYFGSSTVVPATRDTRSIPAEYHTYETLTAELATLATDHPDIVQVRSIGQSVQGREMWMVKITANPDVDEDEPEFVYFSSMHGDEVVGKELCIALIHVLTDNYPTDPRIADLVDNTEIWIMPSMNPDGTALDQRYNANGYDLNRHFPDQFDDPVNSPDGRQPEAQAVMGWALNRRTSLGANFHGGALLANYPFDSNPQGASVFSPSPDQDVAYSVSRSYADNNPPMYANTSFDHGVTNGAEWYAVNGAMQDWRYVWSTEMHVTLEISNVKWPPATELPGFWSDNQESMLAYMERVHEGIRGIVTDAESGAPVDAQVLVVGNPFPAYTDPAVGDYHRLLWPGTYDLEVSAVGYETQVVEGAVVAAGPASRFDVALVPQATLLTTVAARVEDGSGGNGRLDAGETTDLALRVRNVGRDASGVQGMLVPTGWYADVTRPGAVYPDLALGQEGETVAPYHEVAVDPGVPDGHKVGFALRWIADGVVGLSDPIYFDIGAASCDSIAASDTPQQVSDLLPDVVSNVAIATGGATSGVRVTLDLSHTYVGDLTVDLRSPSGTLVALHNRSGGSADDIVGTYPDTLSPAEPLSGFDGETAAGTWSLEIADHAGGDFGTLNGWTLEVCAAPTEAVTPEMRFRDLMVGPSGITVEWWDYPGLDSYRVYRSTDPTSASSFVDVTAEDSDSTDAAFTDVSTDELVFYLVTGVGPAGEGPKGHFGE